MSCQCEALAEASDVVLRCMNRGIMQAGFLTLFGF